MPDTIRLYFPYRPSKFHAGLDFHDRLLAAQSFQYLQSELLGMSRPYRRNHISVLFHGFSSLLVIRHLVFDAAVACDFMPRSNPVMLENDGRAAYRTDQTPGFII